MRTISRACLGECIQEGQNPRFWRVPRIKCSISGHILCSVQVPRVKRLGNTHVVILDLICNEVSDSKEERERRCIEGRTHTLWTLIFFLVNSPLALVCCAFLVNSTSLSLHCNIEDSTVRNS